ncbi:Uncharacterised protein [Enterococcus casseliflavus]|jgi:hypothetical protein|nr:hypothetical protein SAMN04487887_104168 [Enterococcus casseliflavus]STP34847.1 Uncharacterised protein [Enterococcus casseliflavus]
MAFINSDRLWITIGNDILLIISIILILYYIFTGSRFKKDTFNNPFNSKLLLWIAVSLILITLLLE